MRKFGLVLTLCISLLVLPSFSSRNMIVVSTQEDFDKLTQRLTQALQLQDNEIYIALSPGLYEFKENHIKLSGKDAANKSIHIVGNGAVIVPAGEFYKNGDFFDDVFTTDDSWMCGKTDIDIWSHVRYAEGLIEVINEKEKLCRLKSKEVIPDNQDVRNAYILLMHWYQSSVYKIEKIDRGYIYFTANDLNTGYKNGYNVNDDYNFGKQEIRYKLCNVETGDDYLRIVDGIIHLPNGIKSVRKGSSNRFVYIWNSKFKSFEITGIQFQGNKYYGASAALSFENLSCETVRIHNCEFRGLRGRVIGAISTNDLTIDNNSFIDCYDYGIISNNSCERTLVRKNDFYRMGKRLNNTFCVSCYGPDFRVEKNTFLDYGFDGIGAGMVHKSSLENKCYGVICNNTLSYSSDYLEDKANYTIMDSGAIYLRTKNYGVVIKNNYIHDIDGMFTNQGIYCDNGAFGYQIYGNVIIRIANSYCIGSRRDAAGEERNCPGSGIDATNVNNVVRDNIIDGRILFVGNEIENNGCVFGNNYMLMSNGGDVPIHTIKNVTEEGRIILLDHTGYRRGRIGVSRPSYKALKKNPEWKWFQKIMISKRD